MAVQLCGERRIVSARSALAVLAADAAVPATLRLAASHSLTCLRAFHGGKEIAQ